MKNKITIIGLAISFVIFFVALFIPEKPKEGEPQKLYVLKDSDIQKLTYSGPMKLAENAPEISISYSITPQPYPYKQGEFFWKIDILEFPPVEKWPFEKKWHSAMARYASLKSFYGLNLVRSIIKDFSALEYLFIVDADPQRDSLYGLKPCQGELSIELNNKSKQFCIGLPVQNNSRRYVRESNGKTYLMADYIFRRIENNIFAQKNLAVSPFDPEDISYIKVIPGKKFPMEYGAIQQVQKSGLEFKVKYHSKPGEPDRKVWYLENDMFLPPSHAGITAVEMLRSEVEYADSVPPDCDTVMKAEAGRHDTAVGNKQLFTYEICMHKNVPYLVSEFSTGKLKSGSWQRFQVNFRKMNEIIRENQIKMNAREKVPTPQMKKVN